MTATPRSAATTWRTACAIGFCAALTACTSSGHPARSGPPGQSTSGPTGTNGTTQQGPPTSSSGGTKSADTGAKPLTTLTVQGSHLTYAISVWQRETSKCSGHVAGAGLTALVRAKACTVTRLAGTTTVNGKRLGVSEATLTFTGPSAAGARSAVRAAGLLTSSSANEVVDLLHDGKHLPSGPRTVPAGAPANAVNRGPVVTVVRAWYLSGRTTTGDPRLNEAVEDLSAV